MRYEQLILGQVIVGDTAEGAFLWKLLRFTITNADPASVAPNTVEEQTIAVPGVKAGDMPIGMEVTAGMGGLISKPVRIVTDDELIAQFANPTGGAVDIDPGQYLRLTVLRPGGFS